MKDLTLKPGVAVVYRSALRYNNAPEDAITIDMFDASIPAMGEEVHNGRAAHKLTQNSQEMNTSMVFREEMPEFLPAKIDTLHVAFKAIHGDTFYVQQSVSVPGIGIAYGSGAKWIIITKEDLRGTRWE